MTKRTITETIEEYDANGKLIRKVITKTEEEEEGNTQLPPMLTTYPWWLSHPSDVIYSTETNKI